jgi:hypothetical protein
MMLAFVVLVHGACPPGRYRGVNSCVDCPAGQMQNEAGAAGCSNCPLDTFSDRAAASCSPCPHGKFTLDNTRRSACSFCEAGRHAVSFESGLKCVACDPGRSSSDPASIPLNARSAIACKGCVAGHFQHFFGGSSCNLCPLGKWSAPHSSSCQLCPAGRLSSARPLLELGASANGSKSTGVPSKDAAAPVVFTAATSCSPCPVGRFSSSAGAHACAKCPVARFARQGWAECDACSQGQTSNTGEGACTRGCGPGRYVVKRTSGTSFCAACAPGRFSNSGLDTGLRCLGCPAGKHGSKPGSAACHSCPAGQTTGPRVGVSAARCSVSCAAGKFCESGSAKCNTCPAGSVAPNTRSSRCYRCPLGRVSTTAFTRCSPCAADQVADNNAGRCRACSPHTAPRRTVDEAGVTGLACTAVKTAPKPCACDGASEIRRQGSFPRITERCRLRDGLKLPCLLPDSELLHPGVSHDLHTGRWLLCQSRALGTMPGNHDHLINCPQPTRCRRQVVVSKWSQCTRACGGGRRTRTHTHMACNSEGKPAKGRVLVQTSQCAMQDCPCYKPVQDSGASFASTARLSRHDKVWTLTKLKEAHVRLLGKWSCRETIKQLEVCHQHADDLPKNIIQGLCGGLRGMLVDCTGKTSGPCRKAAVFPTWVLASGADALHLQSEKWAGFQDWAQLKRIAQAAVQAQVRAILLQGKVQARKRREERAKEQAKTREHALKFLGRTDAPARRVL